MQEQRENNLRSLLRKARDHENAGRFDEARKIYLKCISVDNGAIPNNDNGLKQKEDIFIAWLTYAYFLRDQNDCEEAIRAAKKALTYPKLRSHSYSLQGQCYNTLGKFDKAENAFRRSISLKPRPEVWVLLYDLLYHNFDNRTQEAIKCLYSALDIDPDYDEAHYNLGCHFKTNKEYDNALKHLTKAIEIDPKYARAYAELAFTLILKDRAQHDKNPSRETLKTAANYLLKSIKHDPDYGWSRSYLANTFWSQRKIRKAHEQYKQLLRIWPNYSVSHWGIGDFLASEGINRDKAEYHLKKAIELDPEDAISHYFLGKALLKWKRIDAAKRELEKATRLGHEKAERLLDEI